MSGPLLFCNKEVPGKEVRRLEIAVRQDPWLIESKTDPTDGTFSKLVLGERIVTNPLFQGYFVNLHEGVTEMQIGGCLELMEQHLVWQRAEQS
ncbi:hypothetical protein SAMN05444007_1105 [Cribrihabitans marinus]|uniref:Uncharacterized protein n=2 Tax=Cribrihabitans marinus TaxID=1227549 RepID=A0A1H7D5L8_9RHOB|nr:hypothetical protein SAMN05444007_1105 [Cribrihabitans marinus]